MGSLARGWATGGEEVETALFLVVFLPRTSPRLELNTILQKSLKGPGGSFQKVCSEQTMPLSSQAA